MPSLICIRGCTIQVSIFTKSWQTAVLKITAKLRLIYIKQIECRNRNNIMYMNYVFKTVVSCTYPLRSFWSCFGLQSCFCFVGFLFFPSESSKRFFYVNSGPTINTIARLLIKHCLLETDLPRNY